MKRIIFVTGSVRSGKSSFAVSLARKIDRQVVFVATCKPADREMKERVRKHKKSRPKTWKTIEEEMHLPAVIRKIKGKKVVIIDCLTLWISNLLLSGLKEKQVLKRVVSLIAALKSTNSSLIVISNEVGWGIVPDNRLCRVFRDIIGVAHQKIARVSNEAYLLISGIPLKMKG